MGRGWPILIEEGKRAAKNLADSKWKLGDLALEVEPKNSSHGHTGAIQRLLNYAEEIGLEYKTLQVYRDVSHAWPDTTRVVSASWTAHRETMGQPEVLHSLAQTHKRVLVEHVRAALDKKSTRGESETRRGLANLPSPARVQVINEVAQEDFSSSDRAELIKALTTDEKALTEALRSSKTANRVAAAVNTRQPWTREELDAVRRAKMEKRDSPPSSTLDLVYEFRKVHRTLEQIASFVSSERGAVRENLHEFVSQEIKWLRNALDLIESRFQGEPIDVSLSKLLEEN